MRQINSKVTAKVDKAFNALMQMPREGQRSCSADVIDVFDY